MFGNDVIKQALTLHGILYVGQIPGSDAYAMCQTAFNNMLAEWNAAGVAVFSVILNSYALTGGNGSYTLGPGGPAPNLSGARPEKIEAWGVRGSAAGSDGGRPLNAADFERERVKLDNAAAMLGLLSAGALTGGRVKILNYDADFPYGTLTLYPVPSGVLTIDLWIWDQLTSIVDFVATQLNFPPGYLKAIIYNLALDLAPLFGRQIDPGVKMIADQTKATLAATNISELTRLDPRTEAPPPARQ